MLLEDSLLWQLANTVKLPFITPCAPCGQQLNDAADVSQIFLPSVELVL